MLPLISRCSLRPAAILPVYSDTVSVPVLYIGPDTVSTIISGSEDLKLCSSMTLVHAAAPEEPVFSQVLEKFFGGRQDEKTLRILKAGFRTR